MITTGGLPLRPYTYFAEVIDVYDADTITVNWDLGDSLIKKKVKLRLLRIDAYEVRMTKGVTEAHKKRGLEARDFVREMILGKKVIIQTVLEGNQHGSFRRVLAEIFYQIEGDEAWINLNDELVGRKYAKYKKY